MLENYSRNQDGIIYQVERKPFDYTGGYNNYYKEIQDSTRYTSYLRLGYIVGSIGRIPESILDVGYGTGAFLQSCESEIKERYGHDISGWEVPSGCKFVDNILHGHYDVITFFDSLEHMNDIEFVKNLNCNYICISVPDCHYFDDEWFDNWKHKKPDEHLWHFNKDSLKTFMSRMGYSEVNVCNLEDITRINNQEYTNILTGIFKKL
jgi:hypothetical protein